MHARKASASDGREGSWTFQELPCKRSQGIRWREIAGELGVGVGTLYRVVPRRSKTREKVFGTR